MSKPEKQDKKAPVVGTGMVRVQHAPFYNVVAGGVTVEWTDKLSEASTAFRDATKPKKLWRLEGTGALTLMNAG